MAKLFRHKWLIFLMLAVTLVFFDTIVYNVNLNDRGIAIGLAVDMEGEYVQLSAQIILPKNGGVSSGGNNYAVYTAKSKDVKGAIDTMSANMGTELSLAHAVNIVIGKEVLARARYDLIQYFLTDDKVNDNTTLCMADGKAEEILRSNISHGEVASYQIQKMLHPVKQPLGVPFTTIRSFFVSFLAKGGACFLPIVSKTSVPPSTDQQKEEPATADLLIIDRTAVVTKKGLQGELTLYESEGLTLVNQTLNDGVISIISDEGEESSVQIIDSDPSISYDMNTRRATVKLSMKTLRAIGSESEDGKMRYEMSPTERERFSQAVEKRVLDCFETCKEFGADVFLLQKGFYQKYGRKWTMTEERIFLDNVSLDVKLSIVQR